MKRIIVIASNGGHYVQLSRLQPAYQDNEVLVVSTSRENPKLIDGDYKFVPDCNMNEPLACIRCLFTCIPILIRFKPDCIISTGAAPGLLMIMLSRLMMKKSIWIDSIANTKKLSTAGKLAKYLATHCFSQWEDVAKDNRVGYIGSVL